MNTYINEQKKECVITLTETKTVDEWKIINLKYLGKAIDALEVLGKNISKIYVENVYVDMDTKYYHRFPETTIDKIYRRLTRGYKKQEVFFKGSRFYVIEDDMEIVLPDNMYNNNSDNEKCLYVFVEWK